MNQEPKFAVFCEANGYERALCLHDLSFARLMDEIIVSFEKNEPFFIDGAPLQRDKIRRLKFLKQGESFKRFFHDLHWSIRQADTSKSKILADQYSVRLEAIYRETCEDVTSQVIKAFNTEIKPRLKDYLPKRQELLAAASRVFVEGMKLYGGGT